jgi:hypothetical protein
MVRFSLKSEQFFNPSTGLHRKTLRGIQVCEEVDEPNHRVHCCRTDNCNKYFPGMLERTMADLMPLGEQAESSDRRLTASILVIASLFLVRDFVL